MSQFAGFFLWKTRCACQCELYDGKRVHGYPSAVLLKGGQSVRYDVALLLLFPSISVQGRYAQILPVPVTISAGRFIAG